MIGSCTLPLVLRLLGVGAAALLDNHGGRIGARLAAICHRQVLRQAGQEASHICVARAVGVDELLLREGDDGILRDSAVDRHDGRIRPLRDDYHALHSGLLAVQGALLARLCARDQGEARGNERHVLRVPAFDLRPRLRLGLVAEEHVHIGQELREHRLERRHLHQERRREVQAVRRARLGGLLRRQPHGVGRHGDEEASAVDDLGFRHQLPDLGLLQVVHLVVVGRVEVRAKRPLVAVDEDGAAACRRRLVDHVGRLHAILVTGLLHLGAVGVTADAACESCGPLGLQEPLGNADGVLRGSAGNVLHVWHSHHLGKEGLGLVLREDRIVQLQAVLLKHRGIDLR
mmetsp:Transcript_102907/g.300263  ORF Transcript_102907/g.300263 Transcript_102907/m.300263 type:complete len:345 (-) Transcript_102907:130-1164(-)